MVPFWPPVLFRFAVILTLSFTLGFAFGEAIGFLTAIAGLLVLIGFHLYYLRQIVEWLETTNGPRDSGPGDSVELPNGFGAWQSVMTALRQSRRQGDVRHEQLTHTLNRFIDATSALPDGIVILDGSDRLEWCNPRAAEHFDLDLRRDRGYFISNLIRRPVFKEYLIRAEFNEPLVLTNEQRGQVLSVQLLPFEETRRILVSRDVSQLRRVEAMRQDFVANVSHEMRTPLTVVCGFLEHLVDEPTTPTEERHRIHSIMLDQSRRMRLLIDDLLTLSKLETQTTPPAEEVIALTSLLEEATSNGRALSDSKHTIRLTNTLSLNFSGAVEEIRSALENLLTNAIRYTPAGGTITLSATRINQDLRLHVTDTGPGIAAEHIPRLTERFYRVDKSRSRETGGTGLGLAIVKHVLARHGGRLEVSSELGVGSTFTMILPANRIVTESQTHALTE
jgi:two-component system, OmpR family, phosphate regulon sensor histidine kinase PhoR